MGDEGYGEPTATPVTSWRKLAEGLSAYFYLTTVLGLLMDEVFTVAADLRADCTTDCR